ncbi:MAG: hypothetical protein HY648_09380 [Acidobacteria bacterium]|nr:hypothetical protein [Acidobacteriota bacterium]
MAHNNPQDNRCMVVEKETRVVIVPVEEFREFEKDTRIFVVPPRKKQS